MTVHVPSVVRVPPNIHKGFLILIYLNYLCSREQYDFLGNLSNGRNITATVKSLEIVSTCYGRSLIFKCTIKIYLGDLT